VSTDPLAALRATPPHQPVLFFLAGPNGAGKTTFFDHYLSALGLPYVNADRIASEIATTEPSARRDEIEGRAFQEAERLRAAFVEAGWSFCTETVFSDPAGAKLAFLERARGNGFAVRLVFIGLDDAMVSIARVQQRVARGGHDIPDGKLRARFPRILKNLRVAVLRVERAVLFDNSSYDRPYRLVVTYEGGRLTERYPPLPRWTRGLPGL
jgi:predicted ABC-type ATPase